MHRSRLTAALFDVPADVYDAEVAFWSAALGCDAAVDEADPDYADLEGLTSGLSLMVQQMTTDADGGRIHLDIETDDVEAEVRRLESVGATRVEQVDTWWVMRDPAGLKFCVVRVQSPEEFEAHATVWE